VPYPLKIRSLSVPAPVRRRIAVCADFHSVNRPMPVERIAGMLRDAAPDVILFPGDIFSSTLTDSVRDCFNENGFRLLSLAAGIAPCFFSPGNHEMGLSRKNRRLLAGIGVTTLDNEFVRAGDLLVGGCSSAYKKPKSLYDAAPVPDTDFLPAFAREDGYHVLLCHHPEYWKRFVAGRGIELTAAGHAHGGQWRIFGRGVWSPGQGLFPAYADGLYREGDEFLAVSRGMTNSVRFVPRFFNPCEILLLELGQEREAGREVVK
jgi:predicted MPP superfamily phosphohydrolase